MFESVEQLEKEVKEFQQNILASTEFVKKLEDVIAAISEQERDFAVKTTELTAKIDHNVDALSASQADALKKLIEENQAMVKRLADTSSQLESITKSQVDAISSDCDKLVVNLNKANQEHLAKTAEIISATQKEYIQAIEEARISINACKNDLSKRYDEFLQKLESTNVDHMFKLCQEIKQSMNTKFLIIMSGIGASLILALISMFIK